MEIGAESGNDRRLWRTVDNHLGESKSGAKPGFTPDDYHNFMDCKIAGVRPATASAAHPEFGHCNASELSSFQTAALTMCLMPSGSHRRSNAHPTHFQHGYSRMRRLCGFIPCEFVQLIARRRAFSFTLETCHRHPAPEEGRPRRLEGVKLQTSL